MTLQDVIDAEIKRNTLKPDEIHLAGVNTKNGIMHHEFATVRPVGMTDPNSEIAAVVMLVEFSPRIIHVMGDRKLICLLGELFAQDLEFVDWIDD